MENLNVCCSVDNLCQAVKPLPLTNKKNTKRATNSLFVFRLGRYSAFMYTYKQIWCKALKKILWMFWLISIFLTCRSEKHIILFHKMSWEVEKCKAIAYNNIHNIIHNFSPLSRLKQFSCRNNPLCEHFTHVDVRVVWMCVNVSYVNVYGQVGIIS